MRFFELKEIGDRLFTLRKRAGYTQEQFAELVGLSNRAYADIERGNVNMRLETVLRICSALHITPDDLLAEKGSSTAMRREEIFARLDLCTPKEQETALSVLSAYLRSLE
ncbi:MAG: helix-turn-helix transcriptional regulator [Schwartzia sp.]|nr:helix-turn-helix transcriptional regulator [Schwartzia sp. (in: firmicutes)]